ncbi:14052_t:CDS:2 [Funneliformis mosseae]|uniref:14052_t:CDS:1 n=1 Tax=Funneliformis mosseae TaxID=27381 RepID=A0A9N9D3W8_FUNMO|nr:14052_t:CDS:2 [Funneliformis mosseae]
MISKGLSKVFILAVDISEFVVDQQNNQTQLEQYKPNSKTNNTVLEKESDSETLVTSLDSVIFLNKKNGQGCSSFPQSEISQDKKNTQILENSNNSLSSKSYNTSSSFKCDEKVGKISYNLKVE